MTENKLEITKNSKGYDEIKLERMANEDSIIIEKEFDDVKEYSGEKVYKEGEPAKPWKLFTTRVTYNGTEKVGILFPKTHSNEDTIKYADAYAKEFDALGGQGTKVKITCKKGMGPAEYDFGTAHKKGDDIVKIDFTFEVAE